MQKYLDDLYGMGSTVLLSDRISYDTPSCLSSPRAMAAMVVTGVVNTKSSLSLVYDKDLARLLSENDVKLTLRISMLHRAALNLMRRPWLDDASGLRR